MEMMSSGKKLFSIYARNSVSIQDWLAATTFVKYCTLKKLFPAINYKEKMFFRNNYSTLDYSLFLYESLLIISLMFLYICKYVQQYVISAFTN